MSTEFLTAYFVPVIAGICLCVGYVLKRSVSLDNRYIPLINAALGLTVSMWMHRGGLSPDVVLAGLFSGLASTGLYEAFRNLTGDDL